MGKRGVDPAEFRDRSSNPYWKPLMVVGIVASAWLGAWVACVFGSLIALWQGICFGLGPYKPAPMPGNIIFILYAMLVPTWLCAYGAIHLASIYLIPVILSVTAFLTFFVGVLLSVRILRFGYLTIKITRSAESSKSLDSTR